MRYQCFSLMYWPIENSTNQQRFDNRLSNFLKTMYHTKVNNSTALWQASKKQAGAELCQDIGSVDHFYDFWIQKSHHFYDFWIQKSFGPFLRFLDPETAKILPFLDPEISAFLQYLDPEIFWSIFTISGSRNRSIFEISGSRNCTISSISGLSFNNS